MKKSDCALVLGFVVTETDIQALSNQLGQLGQVVIAFTFESKYYRFESRRNDFELRNAIKSSNSRERFMRFTSGIS